MFGFFVFEKDVVGFSSFDLTWHVSDIGISVGVYVLVPWWQLALEYQLMCIFIETSITQECCRKWTLHCTFVLSQSGMFLVIRKQSCT